MKVALNSAKRNPYFFFQNAGLTLIELIIVMAIIGILSGIGFFSFVSYNNAQRLSIATKSLESTLNLAKSRAQSQVKPEPECTNDQLLGYKVKLSRDSNDCPIQGNGCYWVVVVCGANDIDVYDGGKDERPYFPQEFDEYQTSKLDNEFFFQVLDQGVKDVSVTGDYIKVKAYNKTNTICIYQTGRIEVSDIDSTC